MSERGVCGATESLPKNVMAASTVKMRTSWLSKKNNVLAEAQGRPRGDSRSLSEIQGAESPVKMLIELRPENL